MQSIDRAEKFDPSGVSRWRPGSFDGSPRLPLITAADTAPILPQHDVWDCWPLQHEDGRTVDHGGRAYWFFLSSELFDDPGQRHLAARIRLLAHDANGWHDLGNALPDGLTPGQGEWAGSAVLGDDGTTVTLFFTAAGRAGGGASFEQRLFASEGMLDSNGPGAWQQPSEILVADGRRYMAANKADGTPGMIKAFRDPAWFRDPATGQAHLLFTGSAAWAPDEPYNGVIGMATRSGEEWILGDPLVEAVGIDNELERPHILVRDGLYYLFWSTQRHTFSPNVEAGPNGLYAMVADSLAGPWRAVNGNGLVAANPAEEPSQAYSWWVTGEGEVWSFIDHWGMKGRTFATHPATLRGQFGGTPAPVFSLAFDEDSVTIA